MRHTKDQKEIIALNATINVLREKIDRDETILFTYRKQVRMLARDKKYLLLRVKELE